MKASAKITIVVILLAAIGIILILKVRNARREEELFFGEDSVLAEVEPADSSTRKNELTAGSKGDKESIKVTFLELGSIECVPCKMMVPIMKEIEEEYKDQVKVIFYDVKTEEGRKYGQLYNISVIPTQVFLDKGGKEYFRHTGYFPKEGLIEALKMQGVQ